MTKIDKPIQLETYNLLRAALSLFKKTPAELAGDELTQAKIQALNEFKIESRVLNTPEAASVIITDQEIQQAYQEIRDRYQDEDSFLIDLEKNKLDNVSLLAALHRQCKVNTVLEFVARNAPDINEVEIGIYYHLHAEQFNRPERREVCHIFISINPDYPENTEEMALIRAQEIAEKLQKKPHKFADLALKHSECPTALQGGVLGTVSRGTLYPELDEVLFTLKAGQVSDAVQSEIGFHVVLCKSIHKPETLSLAKATPKIRQLMKERARRTCQRAWIASLPIPESGESSHD
ncbi:MAG: nitrogen fixation protein NifM [Methylococcaceae bacterium]|nr:nitrogen fixation protein NifM [Methylococcaceae bacterium]MDZ4156339.1 nitrogen fixation protein NifM [Methylococcales bacterium]MDP2394600.1 nitrogen fixation protein NifM [Methylococcaceae bacterium]MDP3019068.1 nitrogen fixation protein NifM [Methylococcaceae bacterium]MDP3390284.1 nitrogen fixation protein NifM [Methylococcaceae bacterium]